MNDKSFSIFVVDDDALQRMIVTDHLQGKNYEIHEFASGADCLAAMDPAPNLILLDIEMPDQNGLEVCKILRDDGNDDTQVIFISAHDDMETLMSAFQVGGNDFIPKNASKDLLLRKVELAIEAAEQKQQLQQQLSFAQQTAFTAMSSLGETGVVLGFLRESFSCQDMQTLGQLTIDTLNQFGLEAMLKLCHGSAECYLRVDAICTELEKSILTYAAKLGRISQKGDRLVFNYPYITVLITGLDAADVDLIGRLRDHIALIAEAVGMRIDAMQAEQKRLQAANERIESMKALSDLFIAIDERQTANKSRLEKLVDQHHSEMEEAFVHLGLTDEQELRLNDSVNHLVTEVETLFTEDDKLALQLSEIINKQKSLIDAD